jgi:ABC-type glycerol-3-phosphate transport system permease component
MKPEMLETRSRLSRTALQIVATVVVVPFAIPLVAAVDGSLRGRGWGNYRAVLELDGLWLFFRNSAVITALTLCLVYSATLMAAYAFAKLRVVRRELFFWMILAALTLPEVVLLAPLFATATRLGTYNTYWAVVLPIAGLQIPFTVLLSRGFVEGIPDSLFEVARIDGAGALRVFWNVVLPLTRPIGAAIVVLVIINSWNQFLLPLVFFQNPEYQVVTQISQYFQGQYNDDETKILAGAVIAALPEVVAYILLQRFFERGMAAGALK